MILKAKHSLFWSTIANIYCYLNTVRNFTPKIICNSEIKSDLPILIISNHMSWWDGIWVWYLNQVIFKRKFHYMMLEKELRKHWYLNYCGGFSIRKNSRSINETIEYTCELLSDSRNMVLLFPQGRINSMHNHEFIFEKGIEHILNTKKNEIQLLFLVSLIDFFSSKKPGLFMYLTEYTDNVNHTEKIQQRFQEFYLSCIETQKRKAK